MAKASARGADRVPERMPDGHLRPLACMSLADCGKNQRNTCVHPLEVETSVATISRAERGA